MVPTPEGTRYTLEVYALKIRSLMAVIARYEKRMLAHSHANATIQDRQIFDHTHRLWTHAQKLLEEEERKLRRADRMNAALRVASQRQAGRDSGAGSTSVVAEDAVTSRATGEPKSSGSSLCGMWLAVAAGATVVASYMGFRGMRS